eukprot:2545793-Pyramimonas_sp.AAC.3
MAVRGGLRLSRGHALAGELHQARHDEDLLGRQLLGGDRLQGVEHLGHVRVADLWSEGAAWAPKRSKRSKKRPNRSTGAAL